MRKNYFQRWLTLGAIGLLLIGIGLGLLVETIYLRTNQASFSRWGGMGLLSLSLVTMGLAAFGEGIVNRVFCKLRKRRRGAE